MVIESQLNPRKRVLVVGKSTKYCQFVHLVQGSNFLTNSLFFLLFSVYLSVSLFPHTYHSLWSTDNFNPESVS
ncbi:hypothetical protein AQUCO_05600016v1 [Aquilegia coerulea]|uniref:Uncharacterized protein n=1 Tax=Aquilegia coerulea TaxID=218851 RepID=A0A2G5CGB1_AQUCA|nr:hypothetical protein AQUCO_05600016v1 [Aquilegia coerulea]